VIGCCTFPTWNGFPGFFADLATGNAVVVKPHPAAILPLALLVKIAREVLSEAGFDPNVVTLVAHEPGDAIAQTLALRPEVRLIDFTGSSANGNWLEANARHAQVYTEKSGVNQIVVDSTDDFKGVARNIAFSLALYTGQMCTCAAEHLRAEGRHRHRGWAPDVRPGRAGHRRGGAEAPRRSGARRRDPRGSRQRRGDAALEAARKLGPIVLDTQSIAHPSYPQALIRTPLVVKLDAADRETYLSEWFGPIAFVIAPSRRRRASTSSRMP
jgi:acyl-CoA reductase-like NAD-dependent aldehyde dehydrogenase